MLFAALVIIAKIWRQPKCPLTVEWIKKMWYIDTLEFYSATREKEILTFVAMWMKLEHIMFNEVS